MLSENIQYISSLNIRAASILKCIYIANNIQGGPKSKPLPNDKKIVLNRSYVILQMRLDLFAKLKYQSSMIILLVGIRYSICDLLFEFFIA